MTTFNPGPDRSIPLDQEISSIIDARSHVHDPVHRHIALLTRKGVDRTILFGMRPHPERATDLTGLRREFGILSEKVSGRPSSSTAYVAERADEFTAIAAVVHLVRRGRGGAGDVESVEPPVRPG